MDFALAALYLDNSAEEAVKVACELSIYCEEPIQMISKTTDTGSAKSTGAAKTTKTTKK